MLHFFVLGCWHQGQTAHGRRYRVDFRPCFSWVYPAELEQDIYGCKSPSIFPKIKTKLQDNQSCKCFAIRGEKPMDDIQTGAPDIDCPLRST